MRNKRVDKAITTIFEENEKDQMWSLYLAYVSNPLIENMSYEGFEKRINGKKEKSSKVKRKVQKKVNMQKQVQMSEQILQNFVPPVKGGML